MSSGVFTPMASDREKRPTMSLGGFYWLPHYMDGDFSSIPILPRYQSAAGRYTRYFGDASIGVYDG